MKHTIIFLLALNVFFLSCCILHKFKKSPCMDLKEDITSNWKRIKDFTFWNPDVTFVRNNELINRIENKYKTCLINTPRDSIIQLFGTTLFNSPSQIVYVCAPTESRNEEDKICIKFLINNQGKVSDILITDCGTRID